MIEISFTSMVIFISIIWCLVRAVSCLKNKKINWLRELQLLLVYVCIIVVVRITFCPFARIDGKLQPLIFDSTKVFPFRINLLPIVHMFDYVNKNEAILNFIGNTTMFIPIGIIFPAVYKELNTPFKAIAAGVGFSLCVEILQLPFYDRVTDIDDLLMNTLGYLAGYGVYVLVKKVKSR